MRIGSSELILIIIIALILFGGGKVAGLGKALGTSIREFKEELHKTETKDGTDKDGETPHK